MKPRRNGKFSLVFVVYLLTAGLYFIFLENQAPPESPHQTAKKVQCRIRLFPRHTITVLALQLRVITTIPPTRLIMDNKIVGLTQRNNPTMDTITIGSMDLIMEIMGNGVAMEITIKCNSSLGNSFNGSRYQSPHLF